jgi:hypothetical protein
MSLNLIAFDIKIKHLDEVAVITVDRFGHQFGASLILNTRGRGDLDNQRLRTESERCSLNQSQ